MALHAPGLVAVGALMVLMPGRTLSVLVALVGVALCVFGLLSIARAFDGGLTTRDRLATVAIGLVALGAGTLVLLRPEGSVRPASLVTGIGLVAVGVVAVVRGLPARGGRWRVVVLGVVAACAGAVLIGWQDVSLYALALPSGLYLILSGAAEIWDGRHPPEVTSWR